MDCSSCGIRPDKKALELEARLEVHVPTVSNAVSIGVGFEPGGESDFSWHVHLGRVLWLSASLSGPAVLHRLNRRIQAQPARSDGPFSTYSGREVQLANDDNALRWSLWCDPDSWSSRIPKWRHGSWHPLDTFLGKVTASHEAVFAATSEIPLPEGGVEARVEIERWVRKRPRWFGNVGYAAEIKPSHAVSVPGKGENSWDCDDNALSAMHCGVSARAENNERVAQAVASFTDSVVRTRARYGGRNWKPEPV
jgi:hypothetical protein